MGAELQLDRRKWCGDWTYNDKIYYAFPKATEFDPVFHKKKLINV